MEASDSGTWSVQRAGYQSTVMIEWRRFEQRYWVPTDTTIFNGLTEHIFRTAPW